MMLWRVVVLGLLGAWVGAMLFFGAVVAPAAFQALPARELAGSVVARILPKLTAAGIVVAAVVAGSALLQALLRRGAGAWMARTGIAVLALALLFGSVWVSQRMEGVRMDMGGVDQVAESHPLRLEFGRLHRVSVRLYGGTLLLALALFCLEARGLIRLRP
ncbi:MAG: DUF4149 domain-containing protein [Acidobacteriota bacterium]